MATLSDLDSSYSEVAKGSEKPIVTIFEEFTSVTKGVILWSDGSASGVFSKTVPSNAVIGIIGMSNCTSFRAIAKGSKRVFAPGAARKGRGYVIIAELSKKKVG